MKTENENITAMNGELKENELENISGGCIYRWPGYPRKPRKRRFPRFPFPWPFPRFPF